jgi:hypothetical protein
MLGTSDAFDLRSSDFYRAGLEGLDAQYSQFFARFG